MRISSAFPSNYLKAADLQGRQVKVKIDRVEMEDIGGEHKPILYFVGKDKGIVLNKTNANNIASAYGDNTDDWQDVEIVLFEAMVDFQGKTVAAIRVRIPPPRTGPEKRATGMAEAADTSEREPDARRPAPAAAGDPDDEIPFDGARSPCSRQRCDLRQGYPLDQHGTAAHPRRVQGAKAHARSELKALGLLYRHRATAGTLRQTLFSRSMENSVPSCVRARGPIYPSAGRSRVHPLGPVVV